MALLEEWHKIAYNDKADQGELRSFHRVYLLRVVVSFSNLLYGNIRVSAERREYFQPGSFALFRVKLRSEYVVFKYGAERLQAYHRP